MGAPRSDELLAEVARLYFLETLTQNEIADRLATTRSNVSRMVTAARQRGIVRTQILFPLTRHRSLEKQLLDTFDLEDALVLASARGDVLGRIGELAADWLEDQVDDGQVIAVSWGRTLKAMAEHLDVERAYDVEVVQVGGDLQLDPRLSGHELVHEVAARLGGRYSYLHAPALLHHPQTVRDLLADHVIAAQLHKARTADIALLGIGGFGHGSSVQIVEAARLTPRERTRLLHLGPVGDIAARFFDERGREIDGPLRHRILALELDEIRRLPRVVGVVAGAEKSRAVLAALRGQLLDIIICDQVVASDVLRRERERGVRE